MIRDVLQEIFDLDLVNLCVLKVLKVELLQEIVVAGLTILDVEEYAYNKIIGRVVALLMHEVDLGIEVLSVQSVL